MALVTETKRTCDVYPGARDVRRTRVTIELLKNWDADDVECTLVTVIKDLSARARLRLIRFLGRGSSPAGGADDANKEDADAGAHATP